MKIITWLLVFLVLGAIIMGVDSSVTNFIRSLFKFAFGWIILILVFFGVMALTGNKN